MSIEEWMSLLNLGIGMLIIDICFRRVGFEMKLSAYRKKPLSSLSWGLALLLLNSLCLLFAKEAADYYFPNITPVGALLGLVVAYLFVVQVRTGSTKS
jgi:purine-cytosine permease-like protein